MRFHNVASVRIHKCVCSSWHRIEQTRSVTLAGTAGCSPVQRDRWSLLRLSPHSPFRPPHLDTVRLPIIDFKHSVYCWRNLQALRTLLCSERSVCITNSSLFSSTWNLELFLSVYWRALIRILLLQQSQTFESIILVFIFVVYLHSDAYLRTLTLSHKMGGEKMNGFSTIWLKLNGFGFFL